MRSAALNTQGVSGRYVHKRWSIGLDGQRLGAVPATFNENPPDLISSYYRNANGSLTNFAISIDLDASRALPEWKKADGGLDWEIMAPRLRESLPGLERYLAYVTRSSGGLGLSLVFGIKPLPLLDSTFANQRMYTLAQVYLIRAFARLGFGADPAAVGLTRDFPNFRNLERNLLSRPEVFRWLERSSDESHFSFLLSVTMKFLREEERKERLYPDARVEEGLARLFQFLLGGGDVEFTLEKLKELTGLSKQFLRKVLKKAPSWLLVKSMGHGKGWEIHINSGDPLLFLKQSRMEALLRGEPFRASTVNADAFGLCLPEGVADGFRNEWLHQLALFYKWHGTGEDEALKKIELRMTFVPEIESSRNGKNIKSIVRCIYRNYRGHFGKYAGLGLPEWMLNDRLFVGREAFPQVEKSFGLSLVQYTEEPVMNAAKRESEASSEPPIYMEMAEEHCNAPERDSAPEKNVPMPVGVESQMSGLLWIVDPVKEIPIETVAEGPCSHLICQAFASSSKLNVAAKQQPLALRPQVQKPKNVVSLQKGYNPINDPSSSVDRLVGSDSHFAYRGIRYSVDQVYVGLSLQVNFDPDRAQILAFSGPNLVESHNILPPVRGRVTKSYHALFPQHRKVRADGHVLFHGKLYSTGSAHLGRKLYISHLNGLVTISELFGEIITVHESIHDLSQKASTLDHHFGPWENALKIDSYYRTTARSFGLEVEAFVLGILRQRPGLIDSSRIQKLFSLGRNHDRDFFLSLCAEQVAKREYRLKPLMAMLDWLDG